MNENSEIEMETDDMTNYNLPFISRHILWSSVQAECQPAGRILMNK